MLKLLAGIFVEVFIGVSVAGIILALVVPVLNGSGFVGQGTSAVTIVVVAVMLGAVTVALFRPGSAIHRYLRR